MIYASKPPEFNSERPGLIIVRIVRGDFIWPVHYMFYYFLIVQPKCFKNVDGIELFFKYELNIFLK